MQNYSMNEISSSAVNPQINYQSLIQQLEQAAASDAQIVDMLTQQGIITNSQRQNLLTQLEQKVRAIQLCKQNVPFVNEQIPQSAPETQNPFDLFNQENPGFFEKDGRNVVFDYLKDLDVDKDEISKIAGLIEGLEKSAIDGYLKQSAHDKSLKEENSAAKSKLTSYAQGVSSGNDTGKIFTREDIGRMSGEEFARNEKLIMDQVKQGLIK